MTEAIIKGILGAGLADPGEIFVGEPSAARCEYLQKTYGIKASGDNKAVVKDAGLIILAVKPQVVDAAVSYTHLEQNPNKEWKITDEDWRNREKWDAYEAAVNEMLVRTSTDYAPWTIVEGNNKYYARLKVLKTVIEMFEKRLKD